MQKIKLFESNTVRGLALALIAFVLAYAGADEAIANEQAAKLADAGLNFLQLAGILWATYGRVFMKTPPVTDVAAKKMAE